MNEQVVVTCVYCGHEYPERTPTSGAAVAALTEHIRVCEKHPMRQLESDNRMLRRALVGLVGVDTREELEATELVIRSMAAPAQDQANIINAIHALIATLPPSAETETAQ